MFYDSIIDGRIVFRLASGSLFKYFPDEVCEVYSFNGLRLPEAVNVVLTYLDSRDRL